MTRSFRGKENHRIEKISRMAALLVQQLQMKCNKHGARKPRILLLMLCDYQGRKYCIGCDIGVACKADVPLHHWGCRCFDAAGV